MRQFLLYSALLGLASTGKISYHGSEATLDLAGIRRLRIGDANCSFPLGQFFGLTICLPVSTTVYINNVVIRSEPSHVQAFSGGLSLWTTLSTGQSYLGDTSPPGISNLPVGSVVISGQRSNRADGIFRITSVIYGADSLRLEQACVLMALVLCGTRIVDQQNHSVFFANDREVMIVGNPPISFVVDALARKSTIIAASVIDAAETVAAPIPVTLVPVDGRVSVMTIYRYSSPSTCGRFRWRHRSSENFSPAYCVARARLGPVLAEFISVVGPFESISIGECQPFTVGSTVSRLLSITVFASSDCRDQLQRDPVTNQTINTVRYS
jgi:hypothetical protein